MNYPAASCGVSRIQNAEFRKRRSGFRILAPGGFSSNIDLLIQVDYAASCGELNPITIKQRITLVSFPEAGAPFHLRFSLPF
jgi:hypothetical protein